MRFQKEMSLLNIKYYKYKQYYKGIPVEGSGYTLQYNDDKLELAFGNLANNLNIDLSNIIKPDIALEDAKISIGAKTFAWESQVWESMIEKDKKDSSATWLPKGELVITRIKQGEFKLAYKFEIISISQKYDNSTYYIDAQNGELIKKVSNIQNMINTGSTLYDDIRSFTASLHTNGYYYLEDSTRGFISTKLNVPDTLWSYGLVPHNSDNTWDSDFKVVTGQWAAEQSYDYFHNSERYISENGNKELRVSVGVLNWNSGNEQHAGHDMIWIGGDLQEPFQVTSMVSLDVVGHEYTHLVIKYTANLENVADESGALNESFADIFGMCIKDTVRKAYSNGSITGDWLLGSDFCTTRSFINPHTEYECWPPITTGHQPMQYHESGYWSYSSDPDIYSHTNGGVQNYWFYLLAHGGTYNGYTITGIGIQKAVKIAFTNLYYYLDQNADYGIAREGSIDAAGGIYGYCSNEVKQTMNAWAAVGVGDAWPSLSVSIGGPAEVQIYSYGQWGVNVQGGATTSNGVCNHSFEWSINDDYKDDDNPFGYFFDGSYWYPTQEFTVDCQVYDGVSYVDAETFNSTIVGLDPLSASISGDESVCLDGPGFWNSIVSGGTGQYYYEWYIDDEYYDFASAFDHYFSSEDWSNNQEIHIDLRVTDEYTSEYVDATPFNSVLVSCERMGYSIEVEPNPATDYINISITEKKNLNLSTSQLTNKSIKEISVPVGNEIFTYSLFDNYGRLVYQRKTSEKNLSIPVWGYLPGIYHLKVISSIGTSDRRIVITH